MRPGECEGQPLSECDASECRSVPVHVPQEVRVFGTGFRQAMRIEATLCGTPIRVLHHALRQENGYDDELVLGLPFGLRGSGGQDLIVVANDRVSNVVRLNIEKVQKDRRERPGESWRAGCNWYTER